MHKPKKITVKHYFNTRLKPSRIKDDGTPVYPLYVSVTYDGIHFPYKSRLEGLYDFSMYENDIEKFWADTDNNHLLRSEEKEIITLIQYEIQNKGSKFSMKGFGDRYRICREGLFGYLDAFMKMELKNEMYRNFMQIGGNPEIALYAEALNFELRRKDGELNFRVTFHQLKSMVLKQFPEFEEGLSETFKEHEKLYMDYRNFCEKEGRITIQNGYLGLEPGKSPNIFKWVNGEELQKFADYLQTENKSEKLEKFNRLIINSLENS
jgi:hypothetical protein